jgi:hypothetical protein
MKILVLSLLIIGSQYAYCDTISKDTVRAYLSRNSVFLGLKLGGDAAFEMSSSSNLAGISYKFMPEFEYFALKKFSVYAGLNYSHSKFWAGTLIERSSYLGVKKYFVLNKRHSLTINAGIHYGNKAYIDHEHPLQEYNLYGSNLTVGAGYQWFPAKVFHRTNKKWVFYIDITRPIAVNKNFAFSYSGVGVKYLLSKN